MLNDSVTEEDSEKSEEKIILVLHLHWKKGLEGGV